ncbi:MAG: ArnT family glycosyltransferase [Anaerolineae bacterium]
MERPSEMVSVKPLGNQGEAACEGTTGARSNDRLLRLLGLGGIILVALASRLRYLDLLGDFIGADEAVGALMARKIAYGQDFPLLFWEGHYGGALTSYLGAVLFLLFDPTPWTFRLAALPLALVGITAIAAAACSLWGLGSGLVAGTWLAVGPPLLFAHSSQVIAGYPEVLCFGGLTLWAGARFSLRPPRDARKTWEWVLFGAAGGFGTYSSAFVLPIFLGTLWALRRHRAGPSPGEWGRIAAGFLLGFSPFLFYNVAHRGASVLHLGGRILDVSRAELSQASNLFSLVIQKGVHYLLHLLLFPQSVLGNLPFFLGLSLWGTWGVAAVLAGAILLARRRQALFWGATRRHPAENVGLALLGWCALATLLFLWIQHLDVPRHLFPFYLLASLGLAALWGCLGGRRILGWGGLGLLLLSNAVATEHDAREAKPRVAGFVKALHSRDIQFVYTDYFIAYPLIFLSRETILASPIAGPANVERYPAYTEAVTASSRAAYVFRRNTEATAVFIREMQRNGNTFLHEPIGEFDLYIPDRHIHPNELTLLRQF